VKDSWRAGQSHDELNAILEALDRPTSESERAHRIALCRRALTLVDREYQPRLWAQLQQRLTDDLFARPIDDERREHAEAAIDAYEEVLDVYARHPHPKLRAYALMNLGLAYGKRIKGDPADNREKAIDRLREAVDALSDDSVRVERAQALLNLGAAYMERIRPDKAENVERAIDCYQQALQVRTREAFPLQWARTLMNLGNAYQKRVTHDRADNEKLAIDAYEQALSELSEENSAADWATATMNLGVVYQNRVEGDPAENIERALDLFRQSQRVRTREAMPFAWARAETNIGNAYCQRISGRPEDNIERAIEAYEGAIEIMTRDALPLEWAALQMNLGNAYEARIQGTRPDNRKAAVDAYQHSLEVRTRLALPADHQRVQRNLSLLGFEQEDWTLAVSATQGEIDAHMMRYRTAPTTEARRGLLAEVGGAAARLAFALAKLDRSEEAVLALEQGRARMLAEALAIDQAPIEAAQPGDRAAFEDARNEILEWQSRARADNPNRDFVTMSAALASAYARLNVAIQAIQKYEPSFLSEPDIEAIRKAAAAAPLVYVVATTNGGLALAVRESGTVSIIWLPELTDGTLKRQVTAWLSALRSPASMGLPALRDVQEWLWTAAMAPIIDALDGIAEIVLIPGSHLNLLPMHTARRLIGNGYRYALDDLGIRYAPSAVAALSATRSTERPESGAGGILAIQEPLPVDAGPLPGTAAEVAAALEYFPENERKRLVGEEATRDAVLRELSRYSVLHFACHGDTNFDNQLESSLLLAWNQRLTLKDFLDARLPHARLVVLSACSTGMADSKLPDEVVSLPSALLQAGVSGIIASLWSIPDDSTAILMKKFYDYWRQDQLLPAEAFRRAQIWVRDNVDASPYHWAAFYYTGC
jgi:tetratricopeptide (TPR) repeat protein